VGEAPEPRPALARGGHHLAVGGELPHDGLAALPPLPLPPERRVVGARLEAVRGGAAEERLDLGEGQARPDAPFIVLGQPRLPE